MDISLVEYGFDKGAIAGFQAMPGLLQVFGYESKPGCGIFPYVDGWHIC